MGDRQVKSGERSYVDPAVVLTYDPAPNCCILNVEPCSSLFTTRNEALQHTQISDTRIQRGHTIAPNGGSSDSHV